MICKSCGETYFAFLHTCKPVIVKATVKCVGHMNSAELEDHYRASLPLTLADKEFMRELGIKIDE